MNKGDSNQETSNRQPIEVLKALSHFHYPEEVSQIEEWLHNIKPLQFLIKSCCSRDSTGRLTLDCVNVLFDLMSTHGEALSPAIWDVLDVVDEDEIKFVIDAFLKRSKLRLENSLNALIIGICQCGQRIPRLQLWCFTYIQALEDRQRYSVLLSVSHGVVLRLLQGIILPYARKVVFSVFERLLYPMTHPQVFHMVMDHLPDVLAALPKDDIYDKFCGLMKTLLGRFPPSKNMKNNYDRVISVVGKHPDVVYKPKYPIWNLEQKPCCKLSSILECPVCYGRFVTPVTVCENGHCICNNCKDQLKTCPICRASFSNLRMTILEQIMEVSEFRCRNSDAGCRVRLPYKQIWSHETDCEYRTVSCDIVLYSTPGLVCNEDVVVLHFGEHMEKCHKGFVMRFDLNCEWRGEVRRHKANEVHLLKNVSSSVEFIERIYVTEEEIFFSYHYVGRSEDAKNYIYTVEIDGSGVPRKISYSNFCLANYMSVYDTEVDDRCLILEPDKVFEKEQTKLDYSVRIEEINVYRMRVKKNKFFVSN